MVGSNALQKTCKRNRPQVSVAKVTRRNSSACRLQWFPLFDLLGHKVTTKNQVRGFGSNAEQNIWSCA